MNDGVLGVCLISCARRHDYPLDGEKHEFHKFLMANYEALPLEFNDCCRGLVRP